MWPLIKDFFTKRASARGGMRALAVLAAAMLVPPFPTDLETWAIRFGVALAVGGFVGSKSQKKETDNG